MRISRAFEVCLWVNDRAPWIIALLVLLLALSTCCRPAPAQTVHVANYSPEVFDGWQRLTVDIAPPHESCEVPGARYVLGRRIGTDLRVLDLHVRRKVGVLSSCPNCPRSGSRDLLAIPAAFHFLGAAGRKRRMQSEE